jgi:MOSC domain-containing protein YiiM
MQIHAINLSNGGVPKHPRPACEVRCAGIVGDRQRDRRYHGGPERAVSLYSLELIDALHAEGHPVAPGALGENLTLVGVAWQRMVPGTVLQAGSAVLELTSYAAPCSNLRPYFRSGEFKRVAQNLHPGWSRLYARVLREGMIRIGDALRIATVEDK